MKQMLDTRDNQVMSSLQVEGSFPVHTHEYLSGEWYEIVSYFVETFIGYGAVGRLIISRARVCFACCRLKATNEPAGSSLFIFIVDTTGHMTQLDATTTAAAAVITIFGIVLSKPFLLF